MELLQDEVELIEKKLAEDRGKYYRGTVRVRFEHLHFGKLCPRGRSDQIVQYLKEKFSYGCLRLDPKHRIPAVIDAETLNAAIESSPTTLNDLLDNPDGLPPELKLPPDCCLECLHGRQRVEAAKELLPPKDRWWTIDLYLKGASLAFLTALSEEYSDSINFSDGEIYLKICECRDDPEKSSDAIFAEKRLWARLPKSKRRDLKQFLKTPLAAGFNALRRIPGLWGGFRIGHKFLALKCDESAILGKNKELMQSTDGDDVDMLQLRAPGLSQEDLTFLEVPFRSFKLFPAIRDPKDRDEIWSNLQTEKRLIPSLWSFFEDIKFFKGPSKIMRQLFAKTDVTVQRGMKDIFTACNQKDDEVIFECSERCFQSERGHPVDQFKFRYWQVWSSTWRHCFQLDQGCPRKEDGEDTPIANEPDPTVWHWLGALADKLGFESDQIKNLVSSDPDKEMARKALLMGRCHRYFQYDQSDFERFQRQIAELYKQAQPTTPAQVRPSLLVDGPGEALHRRCGRVFRRAHEDDQDFLFLQHLYNPRIGEGKGVSSFFVRASVFIAFFGRHDSGDPINADPGIELRDLSPNEQGGEVPSLPESPQIREASSQATSRLVTPGDENMGMRDHAQPETADQSSGPDICPNISG